MKRLLAFHLGPVQDFIATARRTQDLWLGSWLLSHLSRTALQTAQDAGAKLILPDALTTPSELTLTDADTTNHFIVQTDAARAQFIADECANAVRRKWAGIARTTKKQFFAAVNADLWARQTENLLEIYWASLPDDGSLQARSQAQAALEARKRVRDFPFTAQHGMAEEHLKCTLCGTRQEMSGQTSLAQARAWWKALAQQHNGQLRVREDGSERLCAVCGVKRTALTARALRVHNATLNREEILNQQDGHFPSTSGVAAAVFKYTLLTQDTPQTLAALEDYLAVLADLVVSETERVDRNCLPGLAACVDAPGTPHYDLYNNLLRYDGDLFYRETFDAKKFEKEFPHLYRRLAEAALAVVTERVCADYGLTPDDKDDLKAALEAESHLTLVAEEIRRRLALVQMSLRALQRVARPSKYLAALKMDGDKMGAFFGRASQETAQDLSRRVSAFATGAAKAIIHRHLGRLIYAGGDDALALLPLEKALCCARELQEGFKQAVADIVPPADAAWPTPRIGLAVAHHTAPLDLTLQALEHAEKAAKSAYGGDALAVYLLKRSGEEMRVGTHWTMTDDKGQTVSLVALAETLAAWLRGESLLSMKFAHSVAAEAPALSSANLPTAARAAALKRLVLRHKGKDFQEKKHQAQVFSVMKQLARWADTTRPDADGNEQPLGLAEVAKWVLWARFLATGGSDEG